MRYTTTIILLLFFAGLMVSCTSNDPCDTIPDTTQNRASVTLNRIDKQLFENKDEEALASYLTSNEEFTTKFIAGSQMGIRGAVEMLYPMIRHASMDTVNDEIDATFGTFENYVREFEDAFSLLKYYYPEHGDVQVNTCISGMRKDIYVNQDLNQVYVGLDYFLGDGASYRPNNYAYINKRYKPDMILPLTMEYISSKYNKTDPKDNTLLSQMIYFGKAYYFTKRMLPCTADSLIIGYDNVEWEGSELHIKKIWGVFIERELLFNTSHMEIMRYIDEAPSTPAISNKCPGRIGQFLGWKIVQQYMERHPEVTLPELMANIDAAKIFQESKFKPEL